MTIGKREHRNIKSVDHTHQDAVARGLSARVALGQTPCSLNTGPYCKARGRLALGLIERLGREIAARLCAAQPAPWLWRGRAVKLVDGTTVSMPDTAANQRAFPQSREQKPGLGFPLARLLGIVSLSSGAVLEWASGPCEGKNSGETALLWRLMDKLAAGDVVVSAVFSLMPDVGSPFAMTYGGTQLGHSMMRFARGTGALAQIGDALAQSAGMEAGFARREQEWKRQLEQAEDELAEIGKQKKAAELRQKIAQRALTSHAKSIEQNQKILDFFGDKLTNLALFVWLSKGLRELFRTAYGSAYALAKMAERAYRFDRDDDASSGLSGNYWDANHGGLLAAGRLLVDLGNLERRFLETNYRDFEVEQSFSLAGFDPLALLKLKGDTATCVFTIPEYAFNLFYPGQYRRKIRSVRISIPCVAGPYTNVSATLKLNKSWIRSLPTSKNLTQVPVERTASIATSSANNDGGVFEMSFRDERYLPFEGVGAVETEWKLQLPSKFRPFDYETISDVIVHMNYTAKHDDGLRTSVESALEDYLKSTGIGQLVSLRRDYPDEFYRLIHGPLKTGVTLTLDRQLPYWLAKRTLSLDSLVVCVKSSAKSIGNLELSINGLMAKAQDTPDSRFDHLPTLTVTNPLAGKTLADGLTIKLTNAGGLAPKSRSADGTPALDEAILQDIYFYIPPLLSKTAYDVGSSKGVGCR